VEAESVDHDGDADVDVEAASTGSVPGVDPTVVDSTGAESLVQDAPNTSSADAVRATARFAVRDVWVVCMMFLSWGHRVVIATCRDDSSRHLAVVSR
jgi:hypothetical protein